jgi:hypothetical protein
MSFFKPPELDPEMRAIIEAARSGYEPNELNRARVRRGLELRLVAGLGALLVGSTSTALAAAAKITIAVVAVGTAVGAGVYVYPKYAAPKRESAPAKIARPAPVAAKAEEPAPPPPVERVRRRAPAPAPRVENRASLTAETALLAAANAALGRKDATRALALLDEYDRGLTPGTPGILA